MITRPEWRRHEGELAIGVSDDLGQRMIAVEKHDMRPGCAAPGDHCLAAGLDAHDIEGRANRDGRWRSSQ